MTDHNMPTDSRLNQMLASLAQVRQGPPSDLNSLIQYTPPVEQLPSPYASWMLICVVRYHKRQLWALELIRNCVIEQVDGFRQALGTNRVLRVFVPDHPEWEVELDGLEQWCTVTNRVSQEEIAVDVSDFEQPVPFRNSDIGYYINGIETGSAHGPEARLKELHASKHSLEISLVELYGEQCFKAACESRWLCDEMCAHFETIETFCDAWTHGKDLLWLSVLIGDWVKAEELASDLSNPSLLEATRTRAEKVRQQRRDFVNTIPTFSGLNPYRLTAWSGIADLTPSSIPPIIRRAFNADVHEATDAFLFIENDDGADWCPEVFQLLERLTRNRTSNIEYSLAGRCGTYLTKRRHRIGEVIAYLASQDATVIEAALLSIEHAPETFWPILETALHSDSEAVFRHAAAILASVAGPQAEAVCISALAKSNNAIKIAYCQYALLVMWDHASVPASLQAVRQHLVLCDAKGVLPAFDDSPISSYGQVNDRLAERFQRSVDYLTDQVLTHRQKVLNSERPQESDSVGGRKHVSLPHFTRAKSNFDPEAATRSLIALFRDDAVFGMGFLAEGGLIVTAAHCLPRLPDRDQPGDDPVEVRFHGVSSDVDGTAFVMFVDPCADIAVLGTRTLKGTDLPPSYMQSFDAVIRSLEPASVFSRELPDGESCRVHLRNHLGQWLEGQARIFGADFPFLDIDLTASGGIVESGTSGAPLFNDEGQVVGIVSAAPTGEAADSEADGVCLATALPRWVLGQLTFDLDPEVA